MLFDGGEDGVGLGVRGDAVGGRLDDEDPGVEEDAVFDADGVEGGHGGGDGSLVKLGAPCERMES